MLLGVCKGVYFADSLQKEYFWKVCGWGLKPIVSGNGVWEIKRLQFRS